MEIGSRDCDDAYVVRCMTCGHKIGTTKNRHETLDVCDRCEEMEC